MRSPRFVRVVGLSAPGASPVTRCPRNPRLSAPGHHPSQSPHVSLPTGSSRRRWYRVGLAYDAPGFLPLHKEKLKVTMGLITPQPNGTVNLTMWAMRSSGCHNIMYQYERTSTPGHYTYFSTRHNRTKDITVVETNYIEYALVLKNKKFDREFTQVALYGRSQKVRHDIIQKFKSFAASRGFPRESIITPHVSENCPTVGHGNGHGHGHGNGHGHGHGRQGQKEVSGRSQQYRVLVSRTEAYRWSHHRISSMQTLASLVVLLLLGCSWGSNVDPLRGLPQTQDNFDLDKFNAVVDSYVVNTDYEDYAMWVILSTEQPSGVLSTIVKLYNTQGPRTSVFSSSSRTNSTDSMRDAQVLGWVLGLVLVLGWGSFIQGLPILPEPLYPTQENFNLNNFLGKWYGVATATNCVQQRKANRSISTMELEGLEDKLNIKKSALWGDTCHGYSTIYDLTATPGRFYHNHASYISDTYVVHTNYNEYAIVIVSKQKINIEQNSISIKLFSRTRTVRATLLEDFKSLVSDKGMSDDTIIIHEDKVTCLPGCVTLHFTACQSLHKLRREVADLVVAAEEEGSGVSEPDVMEEADCTSLPEAGPCFGSKVRYFYNSTSMSCHQFQYGGCLGNQNNYEEEKECLQRCRTEAACRLPMVPKDCVRQPIVWTFDATSGMCVSYKLGICQGNGNKFYTKAECEEYCGVVRDAVDEFLAVN
ncbi:unnamed protein product [Merluccius merluccius]